MSGLAESPCCRKSERQPEAGVLSRGLMLRRNGEACPWQGRGAGIHRRNGARLCAGGREKGMPRISESRHLVPADETWSVAYQADQPTLIAGLGFCENPFTMRLRRIKADLEPSGGLRQTFTGQQGVASDASAGVSPYSCSGSVPAPRRIADRSAQARPPGSIRQSIRGRAAPEARARRAGRGRCVVPATLKLLENPRAASRPRRGFGSLAGWRATRGQGRPVSRLRR